MTYPSSTNANGIWTLKEAKFFRSANQWPRGPISPTNLTAFSGDTLLSLTWTAPVTTYGTVTNYLVEYTPSGGSSTTVLTNSVNTSYTLTGLTNDTEYTVRVAAVNFTTGEYSAEATGTPVSIVLTKLTGNYTGTGTFDSPYSGNTQGSSLFRAEVSGTVFWSFSSAGNNSGDYDSEYYIRRSGMVVASAYSYDGFTAARTGSFAVSAGQTVGLSHNNNVSPVIFTAYLVPQ